MYPKAVSVLVCAWIATAATVAVANFPDLELSFARFADEIRAGNLDRRILVEPRDEIRDLATAFNSADRDINWNMLDAVIKYRRQMSVSGEHWLGFFSYRCCCHL